MAEKNRSMVDEAGALVDAAVSLVSAGSDEKALARWSLEFGHMLVHVLSQSRKEAIRYARGARLGVEAATQGALMATTILGLATEAKKADRGVDPEELVAAMAPSVGLIAAKMAVAQGAMNCDTPEEVREFAVATLREHMPMLFDENTEKHIAAVAAKVN